MMNEFKKWLNVEEDVALIRYTMNESFSDAAFYMGNAVSTPEGAEAFAAVFQKIDKYVGMQKFLMAIPKTVYAKVMFVRAVYAFSKNPKDLSRLAEVAKWAGQAGKLSVYSGLTIPLGSIIGNLIAPGIGEVIGASLAKALTYAYFYMGQWADNNLESRDEKIAAIAKRLKTLMPEDHHKPEEPKPDIVSGPAATPVETKPAAKRPGMFSNWFGKRKQSSLPRPTYRSLGLEKLDDR